MSLCFFSFFVLLAFSSTSTASFSSLHVHTTPSLLPPYTSQPLHLQRYLSFMYRFLQIKRVILWTRPLRHLSSPSPQFCLCTLLKASALFRLFISVLQLHSLPSLCFAHPLPNVDSLPLHYLIRLSQSVSGTLCCQVWSKNISFPVLPCVWSLLYFTILSFFNPVRYFFVKHIICIFTAFKWWINCFF